jgi:hypothetical protein
MSGLIGLQALFSSVIKFLLFQETFPKLAGFSVKESA